ncbi:MAG: hypothetical protein WC317_00085 [Candidatus Omnitrophota bacterium]|jgi:hypothetical protein
MFSRKGMVLAGILSAVLIFVFARSGFCVTAPGTDKVRQVSGEIVWIDLKQGTLQLRQEGNRKKAVEYRINAHDTFVTDPARKEFLTLNDLRVGQDVTLELPAVRDWKIVSKIIAEPLPVFEIVTGDVVAIDTETGMMTLQVIGRGQNEVSYFVFQPDDIYYMKSPSKEPVHLQVKRGDRVKVEFLPDSGKQRAHYITLMPAPAAGSTTTTTTTTTTVK